MTSSTEDHLADPTASVHHHWWRLAVKILLPLGVVASGGWLWFQFMEPQEASFERMLGEIGPWGPVIFIAIFVVGTSLFFPESVLAIAAGAIFGLGWGMAWTAIAGYLAVGVVFILGRHLVADRAARMLARHPKLAAVERAAEADGLRLVFLLRLSPLNFTVLNWMLATSRLRFRTVMLGAVGMIPGNLSTVYVGYAARHTADLAARAQAGHHDGIVAGDSLAHEITLYAGLAASVVVSVIVTRIAVRALKAANPPAADRTRAMPPAVP